MALICSLNLGGDSVLVIKLVANLQAGRLILVVDDKFGYSFLLIINVLEFRKNTKNNKLSMYTYNSEEAEHA